MTNLDEQIDKIIVKHNQYIDAVWQGKHQMYALPETHQQIKALISDQVREAMIDELNKLSLYRESDDRIDVDFIDWQTIENRIAELKGDK